LGEGGGGEGKKFSLDIIIPNVLHDLPFNQNQSLKLAKDPVYWNFEKEYKNLLKSFPPTPLAVVQQPNSDLQHLLF